MNARDRQFWTEFLELYRSLPAVWKVKSPEYSSRALKSAGYEQLVLKLREVEPYADRALVVKKINSFRTNFRRDLRKRNQCTEAEPFESTLWYFELLGFLEGQEERASSCQSLHKSSSPEADSQSEPFRFTRYEELRRKKRRTAVKDEFPASPVASDLHLSPQVPPTASSSRCRPANKSVSLSESEALAHTWRSQYDELAPRQKLLARKLISDVLYYGCLEQLEPRHVSRLQHIMQGSQSAPTKCDESESPDDES